MSECKTCRGVMWVCECHRDKPWGGGSDHPDACECGAGDPCPDCNTEEPPAFPPGTTEIWHKDKGTVH